MPDFTKMRTRLDRENVYKKRLRRTWTENTTKFCADVDNVDNVDNVDYVDCIYNIYFLCFFLDCYNVFMYVVSVLYSAKVYPDKV